MSARQRLAVCGYGRFGAALAELAFEQGHTVTAFDPTSEIPADWKSQSLAELCSSSDVILVCVPIEQLDETLVALRPFLSNEHLVLDVGSVKSEPVAALERRLGNEVPWVGTHPLFGPTSLARGERPLRVVLCEGSAASLERARALWTSLGCECVEQSAEQHDRAMARSHALAFFLAKGLLEIQAGEGAAFTPPSFEAIEKTITAVRSDAGHLFRSIQNRNPFAKEERSRLIEALSRIDAALSQPDPQVEAVPDSIPALAQESPCHENAEALLAELDGELLSLLARRSLLEARIDESELEAANRELLDQATQRALATEQLAALSRLLRRD